MYTAESLTHEAAPAPVQPSELRSWLAAGALALAGLAVLVAVLAGAVGRSGTAPPAVLARVATPLPAASGAGATGTAGTGAAGTATTGADAGAAGAGGAIVAHPSAVEQRSDSRRFSEATQVHIARRWMEGFYPIYATAQRTFGVNWLLIASIHSQESAFSTAPGIYAGLNFAHCCGGPMQFNVTNGPVTTWDLVSSSYVYGQRPRSYDHMTATHPSIYDDFDSIMAAAHLLSADGAGYKLDSTAWYAAYDYYGHDTTGVLYADQVLARAIGWSQQGFCINCGVQQPLVSAVDAAYGAPVRAALEAEQAAAAGSAAGRSKGRRPKPH